MRAFAAFQLAEYSVKMCCTHAFSLGCRSTKSHASLLDRCGLKGSCFAPVRFQPILIEFPIIFVRVLRSLAVALLKSEVSVQKTSPKSRGRTLSSVRVTCGCSDTPKTRMHSSVGSSGHSFFQWALWGPAQISPALMNPMSRCCIDSTCPVVEITPVSPLTVIPSPLRESAQWRVRMSWASVEDQSSV